MDRFRTPQAEVTLFDHITSDQPEDPIDLKSFLIVCEIEADKVKTDLTPPELRDRNLSIAALFRAIMNDLRDRIR